MNPFKDQLMNLGKPIDENTMLYRVFSRQRLFDMFTDKKLTLVAPDLWDDPFENFLSKCDATVDGMPGVKLAGLFKNFYGQCWTLNPESDAMWRIYSQTKDGARVSTTAGRLFSVIYNATDPFAGMSYFIGSVAYETEDDIRILFVHPANASGAALDSTGRGQAQTLFVKRKEFEHEKEVRLLYQFHQDGCSDQRREKVWSFPIDPNLLFEDVLFDPRMDRKAFFADSARLRSAGFVKPIDQSGLYKVPNLKITITSPF